VPADDLELVGQGAVQAERGPEVVGDGGEPAADDAGDQRCRRRSLSVPTEK
jgi:hypothetical protein